ncbi:AAA family ATPase [Microbacterium sp. 4R-513]|uniref:polysaccharide biosynthesis tyrosine autokinase n=1 Tax=Microbacterium sp. 4R-513 TaxID=2567934 RepID=UPI0013E0F1E7|nr:polysaccharide biosynthesis tyrosine autokinase [Microbacterium sp. 4R-513]QIG38540.1 AAA family ATPase [Microbacterium sp. 4R-513]
MSPTTLVRALKKWWWAVVVLTLVGAAGGAGVSLLMTPEYQATNRILVAFDASAGAGPAELVQANNFALQKVYSYVEVVESPRVLDEVIDELGLDTTADELARQIDVTVPTNSVIMRISATAPSPQDAVTLSNAVVDAFSDVVVQIETPSTGGTAPVRIESLAAASLPEEPSSPNLLVNIALGAFAGFAIGIIWIAIAATRERRVFTGADVASGDVAVRTLGTVPATSGPADLAVLADKPLSRAAESYRTIAATLGRTPGAKVGVTAVAAVTPRDASSALASNLALAMSEYGARILLIDANLRSGAISTSLGLTGPGLVDCLTGAATPVDAIQTVNGIDVLPSGTTTESPAELIASGSFDGIISGLRRSYDIIVVDAPPVLPLSDSLFAASAADTTVLAVSAGSVTVTQLRTVSDTLSAIHAQVAGVVILDAPLTGVDADVATATFRDLKPSKA